jgi:hypothetical protein
MEARPSEPQRAFGKAVLSAGLLLSRQGPHGLAPPDHIDAHINGVLPAPSLPPYSTKSMAIRGDTLCRRRKTATYAFRISTRARNSKKVSPHFFDIIRREFGR